MRKQILYLIKIFNDVKMFIRAKRLHVSRRIEHPVNSISGKSLIIVPHADDELIGCYQFISTHREQVILFYCNYLGCNYCKTNERLRKAEFEQFCQAIGIKYIIANHDVQKSLDDAINSIKPQNILLPSIVDWHHEHRLANTILETHLKQNPSSSVKKIIWYHISVPMYGSVANYACCMTRCEQNTKWQCFSDHYPSQRFINVYRFKLAERDCMTGCYAAETFRILAPDTFLKIIEIGQKLSEQLDELKIQLSDYNKLVEKTTQIYKNIILINM